jgi:glyoxylase-like metal-dependent hydrolase (beta-lactamase superfamily II)
MRMSFAFRSAIVVLATFGLLACAGLRTEDAEGVLRRAEQAMGGTTLKTIRYAGSGTGGTFGQAYQPGMAWPKIAYSSYSRFADYENAALRDEAARGRAEPTGGGAVPAMGMGEQRTTGLLRGSVAWNLVGPAPVPAPIAVNARIHDLWTTPHGVIKAALRNKATQSVRNDGGKSVVSFTEAGRFTASVWINADNLVERIDSRLPHPVLGDTAVETLFSDYRDFAGVKFPMRIRQTQGGFPVLDLQVKEVQVNAPSDIDVPDLVKAAVSRVTTEKAADGVWYVAGGSHHSVAIEMNDHMIVVESPLFDERASPMLAEVRKLAPAKPIRYVINSHHHFDHAGGLRSAAAEGATLVVSELARPWFERVLANPNRIAPDAFEKSSRRAQLIGVDGKRVFTDGARTVEVHAIEGSAHAQGFLMVYLPTERLLIEADAYTPAAPKAPPPAKPNDNHLNLVQNIERLKLSVDRILPLHGRMVPLAELHTAIGRKP